MPLRVALSTMNANSISVKWIDFIRDLAAFGMDVIYEEQVTTGGTFDPVADKMVGGVTEPSQVTFKKAAINAPVYFSNTVQNSGQEKTSFSMGHQLNDATPGEVLSCRMHIKVPITKTGVYYMMGTSWKVNTLIDSYTVGARTFWNMVQFEKA